MIFQLIKYFLVSEYIKNVVSESCNDLWTNSWGMGHRGEEAPLEL